MIRYIKNLNQSLGNGFTKILPDIFSANTILKFGSMKKITPNTNVKDVILWTGKITSHPLKNVYGDREKSVECRNINNDTLPKLEGTFKYCVTQDPETGEVGLLVAENTSSAHTVLLQQAEKKGLHVVMAGHVRLAKQEGKNSEVLDITNTSGHLQPEGTKEQQMLAERAFIQIGLDALGKTKNKVWNEKIEKYVGKQNPKLDPTSKEFRQEDDVISAHSDGTNLPEVLTKEAMNVLEKKASETIRISGDSNK